jgi:hypothetical protein
MYNEFHISVPFEMSENNVRGEHLEITRRALSTLCIPTLIKNRLYFSVFISGSLGLSKL